MLPLQVVLVRPLSGELRSLMLRGVAKKKETQYSLDPTSLSSHCSVFFLPQQLAFSFFIYLGCTGSLLLCSGFSLVAVGGGYSLVVVHGPLIVVPSPVAEGRL